MNTNREPRPTAPTFPRRNAFVVHFSSESDETTTLVGKVEHVASGERSCFGSFEDLLGFVRRTLARQRAAGQS